MELARRSISIAREATTDFDKADTCAVAFSIGGDVVTEDHLMTVKLLLRSLKESPPDLVLFETLSMMHDDHTREAISLILGAGIPVWVSFRRCREGVCGIHGQLWGGPEGDYFGRLALELEQLGVGALLINCLPAHRPIGQTGKFAAIKSAHIESPPSVDPWNDAAGNNVFPLQLPKIQCDAGVFVPTQGSYLVWKYLYNNGVGRDTRCLDIGCGVGLLAIQLALNGASSVTAMDIDDAAVANTLTNAFRNGVDDRVKGKVADIYTLKPQEKYDTIVASLYQMPTDPKGNISGHRPVDYWGRNLLDHCIGLLPQLLSDDGVAYLMQISLLGQHETERLLVDAGFQSRVVDYSLYQFTPVFLDNLPQIERVEAASDAYHFTFKDTHVMTMYLIEVRRGQP